MVGDVGQRVAEDGLQAEAGGAEGGGRDAQARRGLNTSAKLSTQFRQHPQPATPAPAPAPP